MTDVKDIVVILGSCVIAIGILCVIYVGVDYYLYKTSNGTRTIFEDYY